MLTDGENGAFTTGKQCKCTHTLQKALVRENPKAPIIAKRQATGKAIKNKKPQQRSRKNEADIITRRSGSERQRTRCRKKKHSNRILYNVLFGRFGFDKIKEKPKQERGRMYAVYKITAPNGKSYIGMTGREPAQRWANGTAYRKNKRLYADIQRYGWGSFSREVIAAELTREAAAALEIDQIKKNGSRSPFKGYNKSTGGTSGGAGIHPTKATRRRISKALTGRPSPMQGRKHTEATRQRMSESKAGRRTVKYKPVYCMTTSKEYISMRAAARETGTSYRAIRAACADGLRTADGRQWLYIA